MVGGLCPETKDQATWMVSMLPVPGAQVTSDPSQLNADQITCQCLLGRKWHRRVKASWRVVNVAFSLEEKIANRASAGNSSARLFPPQDDFPSARVSSKSSIVIFRAPERKCDGFKFKATNGELVVEFTLDIPEGVAVDASLQLLLGEKYPSLDFFVLSRVRCRRPIRLLVWWRKVVGGGEDVGDRTVIRLRRLVLGDRYRNDGLVVAVFVWCSENGRSRS